MHGCRRLLPLVALAAALAAPATAAATGASITEYSAGLTAGSVPADLAKGADGNLYFTQQGGPGGIGRITPDGTITEFTAGVVAGFSAGQAPTQIALGPDDAMWFTESAVTGQIGRFDPATGTVTEYATGITPNQQPTGIAKGPDGNLWFTERGGAGAIGRITPTGLVTEFTTGLTPNSAPTDIVAGPDGNLWFTESASPGRIGRIVPATGAITEFSTGITPDGAPAGITESGGKLFFTQANDPGRVARIKTDGKVDEYTSGLTANGSPGAIAEGGDGALWFTQGANPGRLGRLWPDAGSITEFTGGVALGMSVDSAPAGIAKGADGNVWFTEGGATARIGRVTVPPLAKISTPDGLGGGKVRLKASIGPNSQATTYTFKWGPTTDYGEESTPQVTGAVPGPLGVSTDVDLALDAHYHVRVSAENASGDVTSDDKAFYLTATGEVLKEKPIDKAPEGTSTVIVAQVPPAPLAPAGAEYGVLPEGAPALGENVALRPLSGAVRIKPPGAPSWSPLQTRARVPVGSLVDTRHGRVVLRTSLGGGRSQSGTFWGSVFQVRQGRRSRGMTDLVLRGGGFASCRARGSRASASALARESGGRRRAIRRLWGRDRHGRFRTHGRDSVATVRGTRWVTTDRCDGTLTRVTQGKVMVRDLRRHRSVMVRAGHAYLARHRR